jgi:hypothetical protein
LAALSLAQLSTSFFPSIYMVEHLYFHGYRYLSSWHYDSEDILDVERQEIFRPFTAVKNLYVSRDLAQYIAIALQGPVGEGVADALPALESLFLEEVEASDPVQEAIGKFADARQLSGRPVAVSRWIREK